MNLLQNFHLAVIEYLYRGRRAVPLPIFTTRHCNRKLSIGMGMGLSTTVTQRAPKTTKFGKRRHCRRNGRRCRRNRRQCRQNDDIVAETGNIVFLATMSPVSATMSPVSATLSPFLATLSLVWMGLYKITMSLSCSVSGI